MRRLFADDPVGSAADAPSDSEDRLRRHGFAICDLRFAIFDFALSQSCASSSSSFAVSRRRAWSALRPAPLAQLDHAQRFEQIDAPIPLPGQRASSPFACTLERVQGLIAHAPRSSLRLQIASAFHRQNSPRITQTARTNDWPKQKDEPSRHSEIITYAMKLPIDPARGTAGFDRSVDLRLHRIHRVTRAVKDEINAQREHDPAEPPAALDDETARRKTSRTPTNKPAAINARGASARGTIGVRCSLGLVIYSIRSIGTAKFLRPARRRSRRADSARVGARWLSFPAMAASRLAQQALKLARLTVQSVEFTRFSTPSLVTRYWFSIRIPPASSRRIYRARR